MLATPDGYSHISVVLQQCVARLLLFAVDKQTHSRKHFSLPVRTVCFCVLEREKCCFPREVQGHSFVPTKLRVERHGMSHTRISDLRGDFSKIWTRSGTIFVECSLKPNRSAMHAIQHISVANGSFLKILGVLKTAERVLYKPSQLTVNVAQ